MSQQDVLRRVKFKEPGSKPDTRPQHIKKGPTPEGQRFMERFTARQIATIKGDYSQMD